MSNFTRGYIPEATKNAVIAEVRKLPIKERKQFLAVGNTYSPAFVNMAKLVHGNARAANDFFTRNKVPTRYQNIRHAAAARRRGLETIHYPGILSAARRRQIRKQHPNKVITSTRTKRDGVKLIVSALRDIDMPPGSSKFKNKQSTTARSDRAHTISARLDKRWDDQDQRDRAEAERIKKAFKYRENEARNSPHNKFVRRMARDPAVRQYIRSKHPRFTFSFN